MATIRLCDWTKERLGKEETAHKVTIGEHEFEVGEAGMRALVEQLEGENPPGTPQIQVVEKVVEREAAPPPLAAAQPGGLDIEVKGDPFEPGPNSMPQPPQAKANLTPAPENDGDVPPLEIPDNLDKRLKMPTPAQADKVVEDSRQFEEGGLPALTVGNRAQVEAGKKLKALNDKSEDQLRRHLPADVNLNPQMPGRPS